MTCCSKCEVPLMPEINWTPGRMQRGVRICSPCYRASNKISQEKRRAKNPEEYLESKAAYRKNNREQYNERAKIANRKWRAANKEKLLAAVVVWKSKNPDKVKEYDQRNRERKRQKRLEAGYQPKRRKNKPEGQ